MAEIYHILSRGVDKRKIFLEEKDYLRFVHDLFEFNDQEAALNIGHRFKNQYIDLRSQYINEKRRRRKFLVKILAFCLMPNHYHLILSPMVGGGITKFMRKINIGYAKYFNQKYERVGTLFQGRYKSIIIKNESHFIHLPYYIHLNPLDIKFPEWRNKEIKDYKKAIEFLGNYRWSSFLDYIGKKNFPSVTQREFLSEFFEGPENYKKETIKWLKEMDLSGVKEISLE
jgi:putative transposase